MVQIGFCLEGMNTEGHDTLFVIADSKEVAFAQIKKQRPYAQHIDTCLQVNSVDGYEIRCTESPRPSEQKLWFINLGGYIEGKFGEVHKCLLIVAPDLAAAKTKAKQDPFFKEPGRVQNPNAAPHLDDKHQVDDGIDDVLCISDGFSFELIPTEKPIENELTIQYIPLE